MEGKGFRDDFEKFQELNVEILGISADPPTKQKKFEMKFDFPFYLLSDENKEMLKAYKAWGMKKFMGREYEGIHRISYLIQNGVVKHVFDKVQTKTHAIDVLNETA